MLGKTISHYKILEKLGEGGMGKVYRAEDTSLGREVAIKVLPDLFAHDKERLARFEREAKLLASLNHPNIAAIYGFEEADGVRFLVLELVEGETLADRVAKGPLPVEEALEIGRQIAEGVEAAHEKGVIHRDLKPSNVKITPEGKVKVLDFGLAKALEGKVPVADISQSPTLTEGMTRAGVILGTAVYMSPEQARGKLVDKRTDIWAFGCVLYEILTGKKAFQGGTISDTIAAILKGVPDWEALPENTPWRIQDLLRRCLQKDPNRRLRDSGDAKIQIEEALTEPTTISPIEVISAAKPTRWKLAIPWSIAVMMTLLAGVAIWSLTRPEPRPITRVSVVLPSTERLSGTSRHVVALSPDGTHLVYAANEQLYLRAMDQLEGVPIRGTEGNTRSPFFSPDGQWVGFWAGGQLKRVPISGGAPVTLCDAQIPWGVSWGPNDTIVFGQGPEGIWQVSAAGGTKEVLIGVDSTKSEVSEMPMELLGKLLMLHELYHGPQILPGGRAVLFTVGFGGTWDDAQIVVQSLETGERKVLISGGTDARYVSTGHLVYARAGTLLAVPVDLGRLEVTGSPVPIGEGIRQADANVTGAAQFSFSRFGSLVYVPGIGGEIERTLVWVDREGQVERLAAEPRFYSRPRLSPDGQRLAMTVFDSANSDVWIYELARETPTRLTFDPAEDRNPLWTPDGQRVVFSSDRDGGLSNLFWKAADGMGQLERLTTSPNYQIPYSWSSDGKRLVFVELNPETLWDISVLSMEGEPTSQALLQTQFTESLPAISPDGRWMAYQSDESGRHEVYVTPFPGAGPKQQISMEGGAEPVWGPDGRELFYREGDKMMAVAVKTHPKFTAAKPKVLFEGRYTTNRIAANYDITPDGRRFLMIKVGEQESAPTQINVVFNWFEELKRLVPTGK
ncbi:protein kinase [Acidobacteria bacterium AH-259-L09]|nr:protein kinase [Acidobacteria bacterium AH-259-L09]